MAAVPPSVPLLGVPTPKAPDLPAFSVPMSFRSRDQLAAAHAAAHAAAARERAALVRAVGAENAPPVPHDRMLRDLPRRPEDIAADAARHTGTTWGPVLVATADPRAPHRRGTEGFVRSIPGGFILVRGWDEESGWGAVVLRTQPGEPVTEHHLTRAKQPTRRIRPFGNAAEAQAWLAPVVMAGGVLPLAYEWDNLDVVTVWKPVERASRATVTARGPKGKVEVLDWTFGSAGPGYILHLGPGSRGLVRDAAGFPRVFPSVQAAEDYARGKGWLP